jgi:hypothetical protein
MPMRVYYFVESKWALENLQKGRLKLATIADMNDPFEMLACELGDKMVRQRHNEWRHFKARSTGALCFSSKWSDPLMWSHYADRHRGVALAFDVPKYFVDPVQYRKSRVKDLLPRLHFGAWEEMIAAMKQLFTTKYKRWEYESEWRHLTDTNGKETDGKRFFYPFDSHLKLRAVLLGDRFDGVRSEFESVLRPQYAGTQLIATRVAFKTYHIVRQRAVPVWTA